MNLKILNAISIKFKNLMTSASIKLCLFLLLLVSTVLAFLPFFTDLFENHETLKVKTNVELGSLEDMETITNGSEDIDIQYEDGIYKVTIQSENGHDKIEDIKELIYQKNINDAIIQMNIGKNEVNMITNSNINVINNSDTKELKTSNYIFMMSIVLLYLLMVTILISRLVAQVACEKGNKVTEVILTSLTRKQLYFSEIISSFIVVLVNIVIVTLPMIAASFINDKDIASNYSFLNGTTIFTIISHLVLVTFALVILGIGLSSKSKQPEDANAISTIALIPIFVSYLYTTFNFDLFSNAWSFLNYIPFTSIFPVLAGVLNKSISSEKMIIFILVDLCFIIFEFIIMRKVYCKNISTN